MTEKDLEEFEKEFGFKLLPTGFKKPLSEITKDEYRERIEYLYNAIINDDSNEEDDFLRRKKMIEEKLESLIEMYTLEIKDETKNLKKYKDELENVLKESDCLSEVDNSRICSLHRIVDRMANEIFLMKRFLLDLKIMKEDNK